MSDVTKEDISGLSEGLSDLSKIMEDFTKKYENFSDKNHKDSKDTTSFLESTSKSLTKLTDNLKDVLSYTGQIGKAFIGFNIVGSLKDMVSETFKIESEMKKLAYRMGEGAAGAEKLTKAVNGVRRELGASAEEASLIVTSLASNKFIGDIGAMTKATFSFSRATGIAESTASNFAVTLNKEAGMSATAAASVMAGMTKVQQKVGISATGMEALTSTIQNVAYNMSALGKTTKEVAKTSTELTSLVGALEKIGISAQKSTQLIDKLLDPDRIEENIGLYAQMGISISDAIAGNIDGDEIAGGMQQIAERIAAMGPIAGSQFGKQFGMSYKDAMKISSGNIEEEMAGIAEAAATPEEQALEALKGLSEQMDTTLDTFTKFGEKLSAIFANIGPVGIAALAIFISKLVSGFKSAFDKAKTFVEDFKNNFSASVSTAITDSIKMGFDKAKKIASDSSAEMGESVNKGFKKLDNGGFSNFGKKVNDEIKGIHKALKGGSTDISKLLSKEMKDFEKMTKGVTANDAAELSFREVRYKKFVSDRTNETLKTLQELNTQQENLRNLDLKQNNEYLKKIREGDEEGAKALYDSLESTKSKAVNDINDTINLLVQNLSDVDFTALAENIGSVTLDATEKINSLSDSLKQLGEDMSSSVYFNQKGKIMEFDPSSIFGGISDGLKQIENDLKQGINLDSIESNIGNVETKINNAISIEKEQLDIMGEKYKKLMKENKITEANALKSGEMAKHQATLNTLQNDTLKQVEQMKKEQEKIVDNAKLVNTLRQAEKNNREANPNGGKIGIGKEFGNFFKETFSPITNTLASVGKGVKDTFVNAKDGIKGAFSSVKSEFKEKGAGATIGKGVKNVAVKGLKGITKGLGKVVGMLGASGAVMALLGPILEKAKDKLEPFLTAVEELVNGFVESLMPIAEELADVLIKDFLPVVEDILSSLLPVFKTLFKALMPVVKAVLSLLPLLANLVGSIVKTVLPPILKLLGFLVKPVMYIVSMLGYIVQAVGYLIKFFNRDKENGLGAQLISFGKEFTASTRQLGTSMQDALYEAADEIKNGAKEGIQKGLEESSKDSSGGALTLNANENGSITTDGSVGVSINKNNGTETVSGSSSSSTSVAKSDPIVRENIETTASILSRIFPKDDTKTFVNLYEEIAGIKILLNSVIAGNKDNSFVKVGSAFFNNGGTEIKAKTFE